VFYVTDAAETQRRLQREFNLALELLGKRQRRESTARVLPLQRDNVTG
jgi:hypothetical protein